MAGKSVPLSVRMAPDDMSMLSELTVSEAITPSDKLRKLVRQAYRRQKGQANYAEALTLAEEQLSPIVHKIREYEAKHHVRSDLIIHFLNWLPDVLALTTTTQAEAGDDDQTTTWEAFEDDIGDRIFALLLEVMKMGFTPSTNCYRAATLNDRLPEILTLARLIAAGQQEREGETS
ncbi:MAG: hypothetical protein ACR2QF_12105 [Geminicoccaceae bacterium]